MGNKNYYGFKNEKNIVSNRAERYVPKGFGKVVLYITAPAAMIALASVLMAFVLKGNAAAIALMVALMTFLISFIGSIVIVIDIVRFNRGQSKKYQSKSTEPKEIDIMRIVHMLIGIICGIIIGYLIWGMKR